VSPLLIFLIVVGYLFLLLFIAYLTSRGANNDSFYIGNKSSPWYVVAFGMIGASLSGVTFISIPGWVGASQFSYMQMVMGYLVGYWVIGNVLMPVYYRLNLTSIYTYLEQRFGVWSYKTGALLFLVSRTIGASFRLYLVVNVLYIAIFKNWHVPFELAVIVLILFVWLYTYKGGIKTIIWTDTVQTVFMLGALVATLVIISKNLGLDLRGIVQTIHDSPYGRVFFFDDWTFKGHFVKQFLGGVFTAIAMTGLDQDMMQKNLSCRNIKDAQKNMFWFSLTLVPINLLFLSLGALLYVFAAKNGIPVPVQSDDLYPLIAMQGHLGPVVAMMFIVGIISAAYPSADSALTSLTTSFTVDIMDVKKKHDEAGIKRIRGRVHILFSLVLVLVIMAFRAINDRSVVSAIFTVAGYTYGPLLGLFSFGLLTKSTFRDSFWVPVITVASPTLCYLISLNSQRWFGGYQVGFELLLLNGLFTFFGLWLLSRLSRPLIK
jgi:SSS family solute:Na+ symporter